MSESMDRNQNPANPTDWNGTVNPSSETYMESEPLQSPDGQPPKKQKKKATRGEIVRRVVLVVASIALVVSLAIIGYRYYQSLQSRNQYKELAEVGSIGAEDRWANLLAINEDTVGWLYIENSSIDLPIVQSTDNEYYLYRDFYKRYTRYGNPFLDYRNSIDPFDFNTIIYGHNMIDRQIFGELEEMYKDVESYKDYPIIRFDTLYGDYSWKVLGVFYSNASAAHDNGYIFPYNTVDMGPSSKLSFLDELMSRFLYDTGVDVTMDDHLLTLSTCSDVFTDARFVIIARLVREGESESVDTSQAVANSNPRYPQAWYDRRSRTNPYANDGRWYPTTL
ncbi:MAG: class B sortase [Clostridiales bacterium]|nr:class B sortase [Clostridiales bacterium]